MGSITENDQKIIDANPGAEPYELLHMGISDAAYQRLVNEQEQAKKKDKKGKTVNSKADAKKDVNPEPDKVEAKAVETPKIVAPAPVSPTIKRAQPSTTQPAAIYSGGLALLHDTRTGKTIRMSREKAIRHVRNRPHLKIVG